MTTGNFLVLGFEEDRRGLDGIAIGSLGPMGLPRDVGSWQVGISADVVVKSAMNEWPVIQPSSLVNVQEILRIL